MGEVFLWIICNNNNSHKITKATRDASVFKLSTLNFILLFYCEFNVKGHNIYLWQILEEIIECGERLDFCRHLTGRVCIDRQIYWVLTYASYMFVSMLCRFKHCSKLSVGYFLKLSGLMAYSKLPKITVLIYDRNLCMEFICEKN